MKKSICGLLVIMMLATLSIGIESCGDDDVSIEKQDDNSENNSDKPNTPTSGDIVVVVDAKGNVSGNHRFTQIDGTNFYIDDVKYTAVRGNLVVSGYDYAYFKGAANIIKTLKYDGRTMDVTSIGNNAFENCETLTSVSFPSSMKSIGYSAFRGCNNISSISISNSINVIESGAFYGCIGLSSITIPNNVKSIAGGAFSGCNKLTIITINSNEIVSQNYTYESSLYSIFGKQVEKYIIGDSVKSIGNCAFYKCSELASISIPKSVTKIGDDAFADCSNLTSIVLGNKVTEINDRTFQGCVGLSSITLGDSLTSIGFKAFKGCASLKSIIIPKTINSIGQFALSNCNFESVYCYAVNPPNIYDNTFYGTDIFSATLHIPSAPLEAYMSKEPWNSFGKIVAQDSTWTYGSKPGNGQFIINGKTYDFTFGEVSVDRGGGAIIIGNSFYAETGYPGEDEEMDGFVRGTMQISNFSAGKTSYVLGENDFIDMGLEGQGGHMMVRFVSGTNVTITPNGNTYRIQASGKAIGRGEEFGWNDEAQGDATLDITVPVYARGNKLTNVTSANNPLPSWAPILTGVSADFALAVTESPVIGKGGAMMYYASSLTINHYNELKAAAQKTFGDPVYNDDYGSYSYSTFYKDGKYLYLYFHDYYNESNRPDFMSIAIDKYRLTYAPSRIGVVAYDGYTLFNQSAMSIKESIIKRNTMYKQYRKIPRR